MESPSERPVATAPSPAAGTPSASGPRAPKPEPRTQEPRSAERPEARERPEALFRPRGLSLKVRLLLLVLASIVPPIVILTVLYFTSTHSLLEREFLSRGELVAKGLEAWLARPGARDRPDLLEAEIRRVLDAENGVKHIAVFLRPLEGGSLELAGTGRRKRDVGVRREEHEAMASDRTIVQEAFRVDDDDTTERFYDIAAPLRGRLQDGTDGVIGVANVEVSLAEPDRLVSQLRNYFITVAAAALLVAAATMIVYLNSAIGKPTNALLAAMDAARRGDLNVQAPANRFDEFGRLAENFNRLVRRVREVDDILTAKVEVATAELAQKNVELVHANERLFETERSVARLERLATLGQLASTIAHEVGTPLNAIYGHIQLMRQDRTLLERHGERLDVIEKQIERLTTTIQGVLTDLRAPDTKLVRVDLNAVLRELAAFTGAAVAARSVKLDLVLAHDLPPVMADRAQLSHVFVNLLTNALDAMPAGGRLRIETRRGTLPAGADGKAGGAPAVAIEFKDTGVGISAEDLKRVFEPFFSTKALGHGTGLGLAICQQVVKRHGGLVTVASEAGKGSTFVVFLPRPGDA